MNVKLVLHQGNRPVREVTLKPPEVVIGRQRGCGLRLVSQEVSRQHCCISIRDQRVTVRDLGSVNGTFVNGRLVKGEQVLRHGDQLQIGPATFTVQLQGVSPQDQEEAALAVPLDEPEIVEEVGEAGGFTLENYDMPAVEVEPVVEPELVAEVEPPVEVEPVFEAGPAVEAPCDLEVGVVPEEITQATGSSALPFAEVESSGTEAPANPHESLPFAEPEEEPPPDK